MNMKMFFFTLLAIQSLYAFSADEESQLMPKINSKEVPRCVKYLQQPKYCCSAIIGAGGGALAGGIKSVFTSYCIKSLYSCPLNVTTAPLGTVVVNNAIGLLADVGIGTAVGMATVVVGIGIYQCAKHCCKLQKVEQNIA